MDTNPNTHHNTLSSFLGLYPVRLGGYFVISILCFQLIYQGCKRFGVEGLGMENGPIESMQIALVLLASCLFLRASFSARGQGALIVCAAALAYAGAREADSIFESLFFDDAYKWLAGLPIAVAATIGVWRCRKDFYRDSLWLMSQPTMTLLFIAGALVCGVCQLLDRPVLWQDLELVGPVYAAKSVVEELVELFAYMLCLASAIEASQLPKRQHTEELSQPIEPLREAA